MLMFAITIRACSHGVPSPLKSSSFEVDACDLGRGEHGNPES